MTIPNKFNNGELADAPLVNENFDYLDTLTEDIAKNVKLLSDTSTFTKYDETKTYAKDDIVTVLSPDGRIVAYISLKNQNNGNALSDENWWKKTDLGGGNMPVGTIFPHSASATFVPENSLPCDGTEYAQAQFKTLYTDWLVGKKLETCTYTEYQQEISATGECLKWGLDTVNSKFKVPTKLNKYVSPNSGGKVQVQTSPVLNKGISGNEFNSNGEAIGVRHSGPQGAGGEYLSSAFINTSTGGASKTEVKYGMQVDVSGAIKTKEIRYFVVVATGSIKQSEMDWSQWASSLEGKLNKDHSNDTRAYDIGVIFNDGYTWAYQLSDGRLMQGGYWYNPNSADGLVTMPKPFSDRNYRVIATPYNTTASFSLVNESKTTTTFSVKLQVASGQKYPVAFEWLAIGQGVIV